MGELTLMWESCCFDSTNSVIRKQTRDVGFVGYSVCGGRCGDGCAVTGME